MICAKHLTQPNVVIVSTNLHNRHMLHTLLEADYGLIDIETICDPLPASADLFILDGPLPETSATCTQLRQRFDKNISILLLLEPDTNLETALTVAADDWFYHPLTLLLQRRVRLLVDVARCRQTEADERQQRMLAEALRDTAAALNSTLKVEDVLDRVLEQAARIVAHDGANIALISGNTAKVVRSRGLRDAPQILGLEFHINRTPNHRYMLETHRPIVIPDTTASPEWIIYPGMEWIRANISAPILFGGKILGFIHLDSAHPNTFTAENAQALQAFADQAAIALQNARFYQQLEQLYEEKKDYSNILERRVAERTAELLTALQHEREISELRSQFITRASHEFRTPLAIIMTAADLLHYYRDRMTEAQRQERLEQIQREIHHLSQLLQDLLTINDGTALVPFRPTRFDVNAVCQQVLHDIQAADRDQHKFDFSYTGSDTQVFLDQNWIQEILRNLLSNAIKYSPCGSKIRLDVGCSVTQISLCIRDEGIGIPETDQKHLFEVFHRASNVGTIPGTGLGLAIVKQAVELHGGNIHVESRVGSGSTFVITIPKCDQKEKDDG